MKDNSAVYHRDELDEEHRQAFERIAPTCPWVLDTDDEGQRFFADEFSACAAQRVYRINHGFNEVTGEAA